VQLALLAFAIVLGGILGFAAHRASICTVRAVAEVMGSRSAAMFSSVGKAWLWVWAVTIPFLWLVPAAGMGVNGWPLTTMAVVGGFVFGLGAAINGACAYSTMARFVDGEGAMFVAIVGFALGATVFSFLVGWQWLPRPRSVPALLESALAWSLVLAIGFVLWALYEAARLWRTRPPDRRLVDLVLARRYRLSTAAMLIGLSGALLFLAFGPFGYTATFELIIERALGTSVPPSTIRWVLLVAVLAGMLTSTVQRGSFRVDWRPRRAWLGNFGGGMLMGFGTALAPGGNDALVMYGVPTLSPYALPTYLALVLGTALGLLLLRMIFRIEARVEFRNDVVVSDSWTRPLPSGSNRTTGPSH
jgi:uncharacterized membrane protein YedE/YeeE